MANKLKFAAIDIGSNAIRMVIASYGSLGWQSHEKYRLPIRLGEDAFEHGQVSGKNLKLSARTFEKFAKICKKEEVSQIRAVATSALRESKNKEAFVELIRRTSKIEIEIIDGQCEARLIFDAVRKSLDLKNKSVLLIDVGGGSVELSWTQNEKIIKSQSFPFGTVRTLAIMKQRNIKEDRLNLVIGDYIRPMAEFLKDSQKFDFAVGTGGNFDTMSRLKSFVLKKESRQELSDMELETLIQEVRRYSLKERVLELDLRPDRADVIMPAMVLVQAVLRQASIQRLLVPRVGLKDGILWSLL